LGLREPLRRWASASADVSDGLIADAGRIGIASAAGLEIELQRIPLSAPASAWLAAQPDRVAGLVTLATGGDDYEIVCTAARDAASALIGVAEAAGLSLTPIGRVFAGSGVQVSLDGRPVPVTSAGYRHR
jgi:thiamine-monophosphate kinase